MKWQDVQNRWSESKVEAEKRWDRLTPGDFAEISANRDKLVARIQSTYDVTRDEASRQVDEFTTNLRFESPVDLAKPAGQRPADASRGGKSSSTDAPEIAKGQERRGEVQDVRRPAGERPENEEPRNQGQPSPTQTHQNPEQVQQAKDHPKGEPAVDQNHESSDLRDAQKQGSKVAKPAKGSVAEKGPVNDPGQNPPKTPMHRDQSR